MSNWEFESPWFLALLVLVPIMIFIKYKSKPRSSAIGLSNISAFGHTKDYYRYIFGLVFILRILTILCLVLALARPRILSSTENIDNEKGVDILLVTDVSISMLAKDLKPDRMEALKEVAESFVKNRKTDRIGIIAFSNDAITRVPLTTDKEIVINEIKNLQAGTLDQGTALGIGLGTGVKHMEHSPAKNKIIILMTDGVDNSNFNDKSDAFKVDPIMAAKIAKEKNIKVYTIGIGTNGEALFPYAQQFGGEVLFQKQKVEIDEKALQEIAGITGGQYFRATDNNSLQQIYNQINRLEKSDIQNLSYYNYSEKYRILIIWALIFFTAELLIRMFYLKTINI